MNYPIASEEVKMRVGWKAWWELEGGDHWEAMAQKWMGWKWLVE